MGSMSPPSCAVRNSTRKGRQVKVGDVVLIVDYNSPRGKWDLALVKLIYPGADVRNVLLMQQCSSECKVNSSLSLVRGPEGFVVDDKLHCELTSTVIY